LINDLGTIHTDLDIHTDQFLHVKYKIKNKIHTIIGWLFQQVNTRQVLENLKNLNTLIPITLKYIFTIIYILGVSIYNEVPSVLKGFFKKRKFVSLKISPELLFGFFFFPPFPFLGGPYLTNTKKRFYVILGVEPTTPRTCGKKI
jgi:hypothetical protein